MKKPLLIISIVALILMTSFVKNSTKKIEDKIFILNGNISSLKSELGDVLLEYNYLSSPKKLIAYQSKYFENDLIKIDITKIKEITLNKEDLEITNLINKIQTHE